MGYLNSHFVPLAARDKSLMVGGHRGRGGGGGEGGMLDCVPIAGQDGEVFLSSLFDVLPFL